MTPTEALALLNAIDAAGGITTRCRSWDDVYAGDVEFVAPSGHVVVVFNDCDEWDYVDRIEAPDGTVLWDYGPSPITEPPDAPSEEHCKVVNWHPADDRTWIEARSQNAEFDRAKSMHTARVLRDLAESVGITWGRPPPEDPQVPEWRAGFVMAIEIFETEMIKRACELEDWAKTMAAPRRK